MKPITSIVLLLFLSFGVNAQIHKKFYNEYGKIINDSTKASYYILYTKVEQDSTYLWFFAKYNMNKMRLETGSYLDEEMTIAHGKFVYYSETITQKRIDSNYSSTDTTVKKEQVGFYNNNIKDGCWVTYYPNGQIEDSVFYDNGKREGISKMFYSDGHIYTKGSYADDLAEGDWYKFNNDGSLFSQTVYKHGLKINYQKYTNTNNVFIPAYTTFDFERHIYKHIKSLACPPVKGRVFVSFTIDSQGFLLNPEIDLGLEPQINKAILAALDLSPRWIPATLNKKPTSQKVRFVFFLDTVK